MLQTFLNKLIRHGQITVVLPNGTSFTVGSPEQGLSPLKLRLHGAATPFKLAADPDRFLGEAYMNGELVMEQGSIYDLLDVAGRNLSAQPPRRHGPFRRMAIRAAATVQQLNGQRRSRQNVAHHYDLSNDLYRLFLDEDMQYSCAYFAEPDYTLEEAQIAKKRHIAAKLLLKPGQQVLDIGCGWGGLAITLAKDYGVNVLGVTLSTEQLALARQRVEALGLQNRVRFELKDYRTLEGQFDRIVSVGMFEHVGTPQYKTYFDTVSRLLARDGVALIHTIGHIHGPGTTNAWIRKYIFPGGYIPAISEMIPPIEGSGLWVTDLEVLRLHYAETLRHWRDRFMSRKGALTRLNDERFVRMWEFYLASSEMSFRHGGFMVVQAQLAKSVDSVPLTRDYIAESERTAAPIQARAAE